MDDEIQNDIKKMDHNAINQSPQFVSNSAKKWSEELDVCRAALGDHPHVAATCNKLGLYHHHIKDDQDEALILHTEALQILKRLRSSNETNTLKETMNLKPITTSLKKDIRRTEVYWEVQNISLEAHMAITLTDIGNVQRKQGKSDMAMKAYQKALNLFRDCCKMTDDHPRIEAIHRAISQIDRYTKKEKILQTDFDAPIYRSSHFTDRAHLSITDQIFSPSKNLPSNTTPPTADHTQYSACNDRSQIFSENKNMDGKASIPRMRMFSSVNSLDLKSGVGNIGRIDLSDQKQLQLSSTADQTQFTSCNSRQIFSGDNNTSRKDFMPRMGIFSSVGSADVKSGVGNMKRIDSSDQKQFERISCKAPCYYGWNKK